MLRRRCWNFCFIKMLRKLFSATFNSEYARRTGIYISHWRLKCVLAFSLFISMPGAQANEISIAVATNFAPTLKILAQSFAANSGHRIHISAGSTGKLFAQIRHGAPFDIFLAADVRHPLLLEQQGLAVQGSRFTYAIGQLVLWSPQTQLIDTHGQVLKNGTFRHLAIANPKIAPYGGAARQVLQGMGLWESLKPRLVQGEDVGQTFHFVASGNAELGFIALAQILGLADADRGSSWRVPQDLYVPLEQQAVLLTRGAAKSGAADFLSYLRGAEAGAIIKQHGYAIGKY